MPSSAKGGSAGGYGYTSYGGGRGVSGVMTIECVGDRKSCFAEAQEKCPFGYEVLDSGVTGVSGGSYSGPKTVNGTRSWADGGLVGVTPAGSTPVLTPMETTVDVRTEMRVKCRRDAKATDLKTKQADLGTGNPPQNEPPDGAGGFAFGITVSDAREACETAGFDFADQERSATCSGTPTSIGADSVTSYLQFCNDQLCKVVLEVDAGEQGEAWKTEYLRLRRALGRLYGKATRNRIKWPAGCREDHEFLGCLRRKTANFRHDWVWERGQGIVLVVGHRGNEAPEPSLRITYVSTRHEAAAPSEGL